MTDTDIFINTDANTDMVIADTDMIETDTDIYLYFNNYILNYFIYCPAYSFTSECQYCLIGHPQLRLSLAQLSPNLLVS